MAGPDRRTGEDLRHLHPARRHPGDRLALPRTAAAGRRLREDRPRQSPVFPQPGDLLRAGRRHRLPDPRLDQGAPLQDRGRGLGADPRRHRHPADRAMVATDEVRGGERGPPAHRARCGTRAGPLTHPGYLAVRRDDHGRLCARSLPPRRHRAVVLPRHPDHVRRHALRPGQERRRARAVGRGLLCHRIRRLLPFGPPGREGVPRVRVRITASRRSPGIASCSAPSCCGWPRERRAEGAAVPHGRVDHGPPPRACFRRRGGGHRGRRLRADLGTRLSWPRYGGRRREASG